MIDEVPQKSFEIKIKETVIWLEMTVFYVDKYRTPRPRAAVFLSAPLLASMERYRKAELSEIPRSICASSFPMLLCLPA